MASSVTGGRGGASPWTRAEGGPPGQECARGRADCRSPKGRPRASSGVPLPLRGHFPHLPQPQGAERRAESHLSPQTPASASLELRTCLAKRWAPSKRTSGLLLMLVGYRDTHARRPRICGLPNLQPPVAKQGERQPNMEGGASCFAQAGRAAPLRRQTPQPEAPRQRAEGGTAWPRPTPGETSCTSSLEGCFHKAELQVPRCTPSLDRPIFPFLPFTKQSPLGAQAVEPLKTGAVFHWEAEREAGGPWKPRARTDRPHYREVLPRFSPPSCGGSTAGQVEPHLTFLAKHLQERPEQSPASYGPGGGEQAAVASAGQPGQSGFLLQPLRCLLPMPEPGPPSALALPAHSRFGSGRCGHV